LDPASGAAVNELLTKSTKPIAEIKTHAGITEAMRHTFTME
jgi:hypothetical protein